jgi:hypothetical protein
MTFFLLIVLTIICSFSWGSNFPRFNCPKEALNHIKGLKFSPRSLRYDLDSLVVFYPLIDANIESPELHTELLTTFIDTVKELYSKIKALYEQNSTKFIFEMAVIDPFLMSFFFYPGQCAGNLRYFEARHQVHFQDETPDFSFDYVNSFIWREFKNPISDEDPWQDRALRAQAHISILESIKATYYMKDHVNLIENGIPTCWSMHLVIKRLEFLVKQFKLHEGKIATLDFFRAMENIMSLKFTSKSLRSDFDSLCKVYPLFDANMDEHEIDLQLWYTFTTSCSNCYFLMKKLYEENPTKFILEVADSDPLLMGFFFFREIFSSENMLYFHATLDKLKKFKLSDFVSRYVNSYIRKEFKKPVSSMDEWKDRILSAKAHIGVLKRVKVLYPFDWVYMIEFSSSIRTAFSLRENIEILESIVEEATGLNSMDLWHIKKNDLFRKFN